MEQLTESELIVVNRCPDNLNRAGFRRAVKVQNPMSQLIFEGVDGEIIPPSEDDLPYDVKGNKIVIPDDAFGIWYVDAFEHPEFYLNKEIEFKALAIKPKSLGDNMFVPARDIMTCCADDMRPYGYPCVMPEKMELPLRQWMTFRVRFRYETFSVAGNEQPVLYLIGFEPAEAPEEKIVYLG